MKVLVTGGAGFIGSHSVEALLAAGADVTVLDNLSAGRLENLPADPRISLVVGDIRDAATVRTAMRGVTHVLHLAAQVSVRASIDQPVESSSHNVAGFLTVADEARRAGAARVVYASSAAVYGVPSRLPLDEDSPCAPISPYGMEKLIDDQYAGLFATLYGQSLLGLRYFNVYGPRQDPASPYAGVISRFSDRLKADAALTVFGDGLQSRDFVYVKDVARANVAALASDHRGVLNVGTGASVSLLQLIESLARCARRSPRVEHAAPVPGDIRDSAMSPAAMRRVLGFVPATTLAEGLASLFEAVAA